MYEVLSPHVDELVVTGVGDSRGQKSDALDALHLAEQLRIGAIQCPVSKAPGQFSRLRELARVCFVWRDGDAYEVAVIDYH